MLKRRAGLKRLQSTRETLKVRAMEECGVVFNLFHEELTQEEEDRIRALKALIAEEEGRTEEATEY